MLELNDKKAEVAVVTQQSNLVKQLLARGLGQIIQYVCAAQHGGMTSCSIELSPGKRPRDGVMYYSGASGIIESGDRAVKSDLRSWFWIRETWENTY
jgi:hypothetical protein